MRYKHLFFDLDHTLWDFDGNSNQALEKLYYEFDLRQYNIQSPQHLIDVYEPINAIAWVEYREGKIDSKTVKIRRFQDTMKRFGVVDDDLVGKLKNTYLQELPKGSLLLPNVLDMLNELKGKVEIHCVTNGFEAISHEKINNSGLTPYFKTILSAEQVGVLKPEKEVFETALQNAKASRSESLFIGDDLISDVYGAQQFGMDQVFFNPHGKAHDYQPTYEIKDMAEMIAIVTGSKVEA